MSTELPMISCARRFGRRLALQFADQQVTYDDLLCRSAAGAADLLGDCRDLAGARVALLLPADPDFVVAQWSIWRAGGVCIPLSVHGAAAEWECVLRDAKVQTLVTVPAFVDRVGALARRLGIVVRGLGSAAAAALPSVDAERPSTILYTSGTTSQPKGVVISHANVTAQVASLVQAWGWSAADRIPLFLPLHHVHGLTNVLACALSSGAVIDMLGAFDADRVLARVRQRAYTLFMAVPTIYSKLLSAFDSASPQECAEWAAGFAAMRLMVSGSAALPPSVHARWHARTSQRLLERYGMTEVGMALSNPLEGERRPGTVGRPLPGVDVRLVDDDGRVISAEGEPGEIQVRGSTVFAGYLGRPDETAASFDGAWFRTGDVALVENGYYRILGRRSVDIIKSGGYKLSALEIEAVILEHPSIAECAVVGLPDDMWGESVTAVIVSRRGTMPPSLAELRDWCSERLSHYKLPRRIEVEAELPRNAMGKVAKRAVASAVAGKRQVP